MTKKIGRIIIGILFLLMFVSCEQAIKDDIVPLVYPSPSVPVEPGPILQEIPVNWLQYDVWQSDFLYGGYYTEDLMIKDFMNDNLFIENPAMAKMIIDKRIYTWIVPPIIEDRPTDPTIDPPTDTTIDWAHYNVYLQNSDGPYTWDLMLSDFMNDNMFIPDTGTAEYIIRKEIVKWTPVCTPTTPAPALGTIVEIDWTEHDRYKRYELDPKPYIWGSYFKESMIRNFMCDNLAIQTKTQAEAIIANYPNPWVVTAP